MFGNRAKRGEKAGRNWKLQTRHCKLRRRPAPLARWTLSLRARRRLGHNVTNTTQ